MAQQPSDRYWDSYSNLQGFKHELLRRYLGAWFPILASTQSRLLYIETHAGRGRHVSGEAGSPLVAMQTLLEHKHVKSILRACEISFVFIEHEHATALRDELDRLTTVPTNVKYEVLDASYECEVAERLTALAAAGRHLAPAFMFVDPFSFLIEPDLLRQFMANPRCEILLNFIWEDLRKALANPSHAGNMRRLFGQGNWEHLPAVSPEKERCDAAVEILRQEIGARFHRIMRCYGRTNSIKYVLAHFTNSERGYSKMNEAMWAIDPSGTFSVSERVDPRSEWIFTPQAHLEPLKKRLVTQFGGATVRYEQILAVASEVYLPKHCRATVKELLEEGLCSFPDKEPRLVVKDNPRISFRSP